MPAALPPFFGTELMRASRAYTFAVLTDLARLTPLIPGLVSSELIDDHTLRAVVRPSFTFLRATMKLTFTLVETDAPTRIVLHISASGISAGMEIDAELALAETNADATEVTWSATVQTLTGLLAHVGPSLIQGAAQQVIRDGWAAVRARIENDAAHA